MYLKIKKIMSLLLSNFVIFFLIPYKKKCFITCAGKSDGLGAQVQAIYSALLYSSINNITYYHTPLSDIAHNYDNNQEFNKEAEDFFSFSYGEKNISELEEDYKKINLDIFSKKTIIQICAYLFSSNPTIIFQKSHYHNYVNKIAVKYVLIKKKLQDKFYNNPKKKLFTEDDKCMHIAFHIRRGDVNSTDTTRYTDNQLIFNKLSDLFLVLTKLNIPFKTSIYSQGKPEDFGNLSSIATLHLNENVFDDFYSLVKADILFMAKSSFSYSAALLSDGIIIYEPFWHPPLTDWYIADVNINTDTKFQNKIKLVHSNKIK